MESKPTADAEMKDVSKVEVVAPKSEEIKYDPYFEIKKSLILLEKAVKDKDIK